MSWPAERFWHEFKLACSHNAQRLRSNPNEGGHEQIFDGNRLMTLATFFLLKTQDGNGYAELRN
jgi:hypothetical protein